MLNKGDLPYMDEMAWRDALAYKPDIVIIKLGTNDSKPQNWQYGSEFRHDLEQMIQALRPSQPQIILCTPIPALSSNWGINDSIITNAIIPIQQKVAKKYGLRVVDLHSLYANDSEKMLTDGIHPDGKGAQRLADIIAAEIESMR